MGERGGGGGRGGGRGRQLELTVEGLIASRGPFGGDEYWTDELGRGPRNRGTPEARERYIGLVDAAIDHWGLTSAVSSEELDRLVNYTEYGVNEVGMAAFAWAVPARGGTGIRQTEWVFRSRMRARGL